MLRASFLALQEPGHSPGQRYRVEAFESALLERGITIRTDPILMREDLPVFYRGGPVAKATVAAKALMRRLRSLAQPEPDVWLVQREAHFLGNHWAEWLASRRAPVVYDFDDAIWIRATSASNRRYTWLKNVDKIPRIVGLAHSVIAGNDYLARWASAYATRVQVIPTCVDTQLFRPPDARDMSGPVVIGWSGSPSTVAHLRPLLGVLERLKARYGDRVAVRVMGDPAFKHEPLRLVGERWTPETELALLQRMDIGVMPLPDDDWTRGKCGLKGLVAMAVGAPTVMSPVGVNRRIVRHGETGLLAGTDDEWFDQLSQLVEDAALRARIGAAGRQAVVDDFSVTRWAPTLAGALTAAADG